MPRRRLFSRHALLTTLSDLSTARGREEPHHRYQKVRFTVVIDIFGQTTMSSSFQVSQKYLGWCTNWSTDGSFVDLVLESA